MATKEQLIATLETFREHRQKLANRLATVDNIIAEIDGMIEQDETFAGEYSPSSAVFPQEAQMQKLGSEPSNPIAKGALFGKTLSEAIVEVLRVSKPIGTKEIVQELEKVDFQFESKDHYFSVYRALQPDRRPSTIIKQGKLYGIKRSPKRPEPEPASEESED